jgi:hypothetical protein
MTYCKSIFLALLLVFALNHCGRQMKTVEFDAPRRGAGVFDVEVHQRTPGSSVLDVSFTNESVRSLTLYEARLPWRNRYSLLIVAVPQSAPERPLRMLFAPDDSPPTAITVKPRETIRGEIDIRDRFPDISAQLQKSGPVLLFWSYELHDTTSVSLGREFGGCTLSK